MERDLIGLAGGEPTVIKAASAVPPSNGKKLFGIIFVSSFCGPLFLSVRRVRGPNGPRRGPWVAAGLMRKLSII